MKSLNKTAAGLAVAGLLALTSAPGAAFADDGYGFAELFGVRHDERIPEGKDALGGRLGLGFPFGQSQSSRSALELGFFANEIKRDPAAQDHQLGLMLDMVHTFELGAVDPFLLGGVGFVQEDVARTKDVYPAIEAGLGAVFGSVNGLALRASFVAQEVLNDKVNASQDAYVDYRLNVGLIAPFGAVEPAPAKAPVDSDGDGVPDTQDRCPSQPAPTADGCPTPVAPAAPPRDTDGDGIDDSQDECPGTLEGLKVDGSGCVAAATAQKIVLKGVTFLPNSAELTPDAKKVLDEAYDALAGQASLNVELSGHTDSSGDDKLNLSLSQRRADSVKKYLTGKGIAAERLVAKGYGETQPIADNKTKAGRTENRRVELKILN